MARDITVDDLGVPARSSAVLDAARVAHVVATLDAASIARTDAAVLVLGDTLNTHRTHYDLPYAGDVEGYPGLVMQHSLATMSVERSSGGRPSS
jgi:hydroxyacyl-ACP dehydratase HTD2-like protein with hotdog domain